MNPADQIKFDEDTNTLHIEKFPGVVYTIGGKEVSGEIKLTRNTTVRARERGRLFDKGSEREWNFKVSDSVKAVEDEDENPNESEDTPPAPTAGNTPQAPQQATGGPARISGAGVPGPNPPRP